MWSGQVDDLEHQGRLVLLARFEGVVVLNSVGKIRGVNRRCRR